MTEHEASRTLVKSPPELWAELSDAGSLARHLGEFGEIRITKLEPETAVAWEGERASGTVRIEPSGWGTKVIFTAQRVLTQAAPEPLIEESEPPPPPEPLPEPRPAPEPLPPAAPRGLVGRLLGWLNAPRPPRPVAAPPPRPVAAPPPPPVEAPKPVTPVAVDDDDLDPAGVLKAALDSLGQAHHRPFSRG
jgi:hypothetical protein